MQWYTVLVIDFCAFPLWDMELLHTADTMSALHTLLSLYSSVSGITAPFGRFCLLALFYIDINVDGRKECYGSYQRVRLHHK